VAVITFTLTFAAAMFRMLQTGVGAVDKGQYEASCALGFSDRQTFYKVLLPQAVIHFMPSYKAEVTALIKATAVVGYIAVQDLTKVGDIIRSRTYEAFFPLVAVAVIYFILANILTLIVQRLQISVDPKTRKPEDILKGVTIHD
jgi:polar amino acid transport system substrate-binding protein